MSDWQMLLLALKIEKQYQKSKDISNSSKVMLCQPMAGRTQEEIKLERKLITEKLIKQGYLIIDTMFIEEPPENCDIGLYYLAKSIEAMAKVDGVVFAPGWQKARGCQIEHMCAVKYGKFIKYI